MFSGDADVADLRVAFLRTVAVGLTSYTSVIALMKY